MSDATLGALIAAIPPTLVAAAAFIQGVRNGQQATKIVQQGASIAHKADEIHTLTNSNLTAVKADLEIAQQQILQLQELVEALVQQRDKAAAAAAAAKPTPP